MKTRTINTEDVIFALFGMGFDKIDNALFTLVVEKLIANSHVPCRLQMTEDKFDNFFQTYVTYDSFNFQFRTNMFRLKEGYSLESCIEQGGKKVTLKDFFASKSKDLLEELQTIDFREIIVRKVTMLGFASIEDFPKYFSELEKALICEMFGLGQMDHTIIEKAGRACAQLFGKERPDIDKVLSKRK